MKAYNERRSYKDRGGFIYHTYHYPSGWVYAYQKGERLFKIDAGHFEVFVAKRGDIRVGKTRREKDIEKGQTFLAI